MCLVHCFLSLTKTKPTEPCTTLSNNLGLVLTVFLIMATSTWMWFIIMVPVNLSCLFPLSVYLFTLREVYQLPRIIMQCIIPVLSLSPLDYFTWQLDNFRLFSATSHHKVAISVSSLQEKVHSPH